jgi:hypothetical protein
VPSEYLRYGAAYFPFLTTSIVDPNEFSYANFDLSDPTLKTALGEEAAALYKASDPTGAKVKAINDNFIAKLAANPAPDPTTGDLVIDTTLDKGLSANVPALKSIYALMAARQNVLPPSGAMAGVCTMNDTLRGVWNAPANVGLNAVTAPTVRISDAAQADLNVPVEGFAVNAIRDFVGRGPIVWGARTLDGNSNDWRYIQVRRAMIYIEQSVMLALNKFVFDPNVGQTWVTVTAMISSFLRGLWADGGLMGSTPQEAFSVQCGLGSTMTAQDILEGRMIVQITLTMVHPAEFIILTFKQQMLGG